MTLLDIEDDRVVILVNNGSTALHCIISAFELSRQKKQRFATQSFTFPASVQGSCVGARIIDVDADGGLDVSLLDPSEVDGIIVTNCFGHLTDVSRYSEWAAQHDKLLVFDNAATSFSHYAGKRTSSASLPTARNALNFGHASIISFHHTKPIGFGEVGRRRRER